jgi:hypothetical protein
MFTPSTRGDRVADAGARPVLAEMRRQVHVLQVDIAELELGRRLGRVEACAEAGLHPRVEGGDEAHDRAVVGVERVGLEGLFEQDLTSLDPYVTKDQVVVTEQRRVHVDLGRDLGRDEQQLAWLALGQWVRVRLVIGRTVFARVAEASFVERVQRR